MYHYRGTVSPFLFNGKFLNFPSNENPLVIVEIRIKKFLLRRCASQSVRMRTLCLGVVLLRVTGDFCLYRGDKIYGYL